MNKQPATLIPADFGTHQSRPDVDNLGISGYQTRPGRVYLSPQEVINWSGGPWSFAPMGAALYMGLQTCQIFYGEAPEPWQKSALLQAQDTPLYSAGQAPFGQAPTSGVYTGVHSDGCS